MTRKDIVLFKFLILSVVFISFNECHVSLSQTEELYCGLPAIPIGAKVFVIRSVNGNDTLERYNDGDPPHFAHDTIISYRCEGTANDILIGDRHRKCQSGRWSGFSPTCVISTSSNLNVSIEVMDLETKNKVMNEGLVTGIVSSVEINGEQCLSMNTSLNHQWTIKLTSSNGHSIDKMNYFVLTLNGSNIRNLWASNPFNFNITLQSKGSLIECFPNENQFLKFEDETEQNKTDHLLITYLCYDNFDTTGDELKEITIKLNQTKTNPIKDFYSFSLCQMKRYSGLQLCQRPDRPCGGIIDKRTDFNDSSKLTTYNFSCQKNYVLTGNNKARCNRFGQWLDGLPLCIPNYCRKLKLWLNPNLDPNLMAGYEVDKDSYDEHIPYARWLIFHCSDSEDKQAMVIKGQSKFLCENSEWIGLKFDRLPECVIPNLFEREMNKPLTIIMSAIILIFIIIIGIVIRLYRLKSRQIKKVSQLSNKDNVYDTCKIDAEEYDDIDNEYQCIDKQDLYETVGNTNLELYDSVDYSQSDCDDHYTVMNAKT